MAKIILDLCGGTGSWSKPYRDAGYDVRLVTLPENDVRTYRPPEGVHGILAAPPCTEFAVSGARWWARKPPELLQEAHSVVRACLNVVYNAKPVWWALENPVGRLRSWLVDEYCLHVTMTFNPCDYGDPYTKRTHLWGKFQKPATSPIEPVFVEVGPLRKRMSIIHRDAFRLPKAERAAVRSITPPGFAKAFFEANP